MGVLWEGTSLQQPHPQRSGHHNSIQASHNATGGGRLRGGFLQGQVSLSADLLTATPASEDPVSWGMERHPAVEWPQAGDL
jgi:hypothetical protein